MIKLFEYTEGKSEMDSLIPAFETFSVRPFKELKKVETKKKHSEDSEEEEEEDENEVGENERLCCLAYHCTTQVIQACISQLYQGDQGDQASQMAEFVKSIHKSHFWILDTLTTADALYQSLADKQCGETIYKCCLQSLASLCPLYGQYDLKAEQAVVVHFVCVNALPSMKPKDAFKKSVDSIFTSRNLAAIEALVLLCKGNGVGLETCWKLVTATLEVIHEYIPSKDNENNYVVVFVYVNCVVISYFSLCLCWVWDYWRTTG